MTTPSNAIGLFTIGVSQIGDLPTFDVNETVISQYANSSILLQLLQSFAECVDPRPSLDEFYDVMWNIETAQGVGLDLWGSIVGVQRVIPVQPELAFGFEEATSASAVGFGQGAFYSGGQLTTNVALSDSAFKLLILAKALFNLSDCSIVSINQAMLTLFPGRGDCHVRDDGGMALTYVFNFATSDVEKSIIQSTSVLPKPTGVAASYQFA